MTIISQYVFERYLSEIMNTMCSTAELVFYSLVCPKTFIVNPRQIIDISSELETGAIPTWTRSSRCFDDL